MKAKLDLELHLNRPALNAELAQLRNATSSAMSAGFSSGYGLASFPNQSGLSHMQTPGYYGAYPWQASSPQELMPSGISASSPRGYPSSYIQSVMMAFSPDYAGAFAPATTTVGVAQQYSQLQMSQLTRATAAGIGTAAIPTGVGLAAGAAGYSIGGAVGGAIGSLFSPVGTFVGGWAGAGLGSLAAGLGAGKLADVFAGGAGRVLSGQLGMENYLLSDGYQFGLHADLSEEGAKTRRDFAGMFTKSIFNKDSAFYKSRIGKADPGEMVEQAQEIFQLQSKLGMVTTSGSARADLDKGDPEKFTKEAVDSITKFRDSFAKTMKILHTNSDETGQIITQFVEQGIRDNEELVNKAKRINVLARATGASIKEFLAVDKMGESIGRASGIAPKATGTLAMEMYGGLKTQLTFEGEGTEKSAASDLNIKRAKRAIDTLGGAEAASAKTLQVLLGQEERKGLNDLALAAAMTGRKPGHKAQDVVSAGMEAISEMGKGSIGAGIMEFEVKRQDQLAQMHKDPNAMFTYLTTAIESKAAAMAESTGGNIETARRYSAHKTAQEMGLSRNMAAQVGELIAQGAGTGVIDPEKRKKLEEKLGKEMEQDDKARSGKWVGTLEAIHKIQLDIAKILLGTANWIDDIATKAMPHIADVAQKGFELLGKALGGIFDAVVSIASWFGKDTKELKDTQKNVHALSKNIGDLGGTFRTVSYAFEAAREERRAGIAEVQKNVDAQRATLEPDATGINAESNKDKKTKESLAKPGMIWGGGAAKSSAVQAPNDTAVYEKARQEAINDINKSDKVSGKTKIDLAKFDETAPASNGAPNPGNALLASFGQYNGSEQSPNGGLVEGAKVIAGGTILGLATERALRHANDAGAKLFAKPDPNLNWLSQGADDAAGAAGKSSLFRRMGSGLLRVGGKLFAGITAGLAGADIGDAQYEAEIARTQQEREAAESYRNKAAITATANVVGVGIVGTPLAGAGMAALTAAVGMGAYFTRKWGWRDGGRRPSDAALGALATGYNSTNKEQMKANAKQIKEHPELLKGDAWKDPIAIRSVIDSDTHKSAINTINEAYIPTELIINDPKLRGRLGKGVHGMSSRDHLISSQIGEYGKKLGLSSDEAADIRLDMQMTSAKSRLGELQNRRSKIDEALQSKVLSPEYREQLEKTRTDVNKQSNVEGARVADVLAKHYSRQERQIEKIVQATDRAAKSNLTSAEYQRVASQKVENMTYSNSAQNNKVAQDAAKAFQENAQRILSGAFPTAGVRARV